MAEDRKKEYIELEREVHPWASDAILGRIVEDELKRNPKHYEMEEEDNEEMDEEEEGDEAPGLTIVIGHKRSGPAKDPFAKEEETEETDDEEE